MESDHTNTNITNEHSCECFHNQVLTYGIYQEENFKSFLEDRILRQPLAGQK